MKESTKNNIVRYAISAAFVSTVLIVGSLIGIGLDWLTDKIGWPILPSFCIICFVYLVWRVGKGITVSEKDEEYNKIVDEFIFGELKTKENKGNLGGISSNSAWSEEDERIRKGLIGILSKCKYFYSKKIAWLKKQDKSSDEDMKTLLRTEYEKGRADAIAEMQKEWSEEDEKIINGLIDSLTRISLNTRTDSTSPNYTFYKEINWLKSLRSAAIWYLKKRNIQPQPKQKWNEEDEKMLSLIIDNLNFICDTIDKYVVDVGSFEGLIIWHKSLKSQIDWLKSFKGGIMIELKGKVAERFEKEREKAEKSPKTDVTENVEIVRQIVSETLKEG